MTLIQDKTEDTSSQTNSPILYRPMTDEDLPIAYELSQIVKWPHRIEDWKMVMRLGNSFVAEENGVTVGTALCWSHGDQYSSLGMVIVSPEKQGRGIGRQLMNQVLNDIGDEKNVILFATPSGQPLYESFGFKATGEVYQHQAIVEKTSPVTLSGGKTLRSVDQNDYANVIQLTEKACGIARSAMIKDVMSFGDAVVIEENGEITGFAMARPFGRGHAIGPVTARDTDLAKSLIQYWINALESKFVRIDIPANSGLSAWLAEVGLPQVDTVVEMVRGESPTRDDETRQYALVSQALG
ncbi:GNAT family N-acetyltransferase [Marinomonas mediterranea]|jgi:Predicted acyltransferase|uniref:GCN5-related N-acetyltransferase n=1 Tax=Marinomonas mediterranea (strain ATCC 700492 / JCM 21426 / NBRC 103028 / MMB-1) TaxID=717774 RepID=F2JVR3_MARM1|nr:GNAT family N-acetyltransferase [Marinomonas mediterranea]ADZ91699.1 GCN5-related N-acetyltransferase [Marinomonas mediterranea MMB-1]WCN17795.1 GNAT family N-acetyltransferase [Marinomonas mediterranea MMB-1]